MYQFLLILFILISISLIMLIMLQKNTGSSSIGVTYNLDITNTLFGSSGAVTLVNRIIISLVILFFIISLTLNNIHIDNKKDSNLNNLKELQLVKKDISLPKASDKIVHDIPQ